MWKIIGHTEKNSGSVNQHLMPSPWLYFIRWYKEFRLLACKHQLYIWCWKQAALHRPGLGQSLNPVVPHTEVTLTFIFMNSLMAHGLDSQLSSGISKLMSEGSQCQPMRKKLLLCKTQCEFQVWVSPEGDAGIGSTERRLLLLVLHWGQNGFP